jgi:aspartate/methionine/tyrosine aminotransferase
MQYRRMPIEVESPEQLGYDTIKYNLSESSVSDLFLKDLGKLDDNILLCYGDHYGLVDLRKKIAKDEGIKNINHVLITPGAIGALFFINTSLLGKGDHVIVMHPNYATNFETPRAIGCEISYLKVEPNKYFLDKEFIENNVKENTQLISITSPHNPTGRMLSELDIEWLLHFTKERNIFLLIDETYREIPFGELSKSLLALRGSHVISVTSVSKAYGLPGLRIGWLVCENDKIMENFLAAKEQIVLCNSVVDEQLALNALVQKSHLLKNVEQHLETNFQLLKEWLATEDRVETNLPQGGCVCLIKIKKKIETAKFYELLLKQYSTYVGPGHWFEVSDDYFRLGFGWPTKEELKKGLQNISMALNHF